MRYKIVDGSETAHCCFESTVVDTTKTGIGGGSYAMCECIEERDAVKIAAALNAYDEQQNRMAST